MEYLKISPEDKEKYPKATESINILFSDSAKHIAKPFLIGSQKQIFYGHPAIMIPNSDLIKTIPDWSGDIELATSIELTEDNTKEFMVVWLLMNNLYPFGFRGTLKNYLVISEWINYFGYNDQIRMNDIHIGIGFLLNGKISNIDPITKTLLEKRYNRALKICSENPLTEIGKVNCSDVHTYALALGVDSEQLSLETKLMNWYGDGNLKEFVGLLGRSSELNDTEKKWINILLDYELQQSKTPAWKARKVRTMQVITLAAVVGRSKDFDSLKFLLV